MSTYLECGGCETAYDVSARKPGKRVRCPKCKTIMVVPEAGDDDEDSAILTASSRLRAARGPSCKAHKTTVSVGICGLCNAAMCERCLSPPPVDHACRACASLLGLEGALPIDFGLLTTFRRAAKAFFPNVPRILAWSVVALLVALTVCGIPGVIGAVVYGNAGPDTLLGQLGGIVVILAILGYRLLNAFLLIPAGCAVFIDDAIRGRKPDFAEAFSRAWRRVLGRAGALFLIFIVYALLAFLILLPCLVVFYFASEALGTTMVDGRLQGSPMPAILLFGLLGAGLLFMATSLGLAAPIAILEQRSAVESLGRAWELSLQRFWGLCAVFLGLGLLYLAASIIGLLTLPLFGFLITLLLDLFWPAVLVSAYHGLVAEHAGVLGRGG